MIYVKYNVLIIITRRKYDSEIFLLLYFTCNLFVRIGRSLDEQTRSSERYRLETPRPRSRSRSLPRTIGPFAQFIMFRLSSHLTREIEWRFSFGDTGSLASNNNGGLSSSLPLRSPSPPPLFRAPLSVCSHCPASNYCTRNDRPFAAVLRYRVSVIRTLVSGLRFSDASRNPSVALLADP